jgi:hypothetical protein
VPEFDPGLLVCELPVGFGVVTGGMRAFVDDRRECLTPFRAQPDEVLPDLDRWRDAIPATLMRLPESHGYLFNSLTRATSTSRR